MCGMPASYTCCILVWIIYCISLVHSWTTHVILSHDGPVVLGGTITIRADLFTADGQRPSGTFKYRWSDDALKTHEYLSEATENTTSIWRLSYPREKYSVGTYKVEVVVEKREIHLFWSNITSSRTSFDVTSLLNGNLTVLQSNKTLDNEFVSSASETQFSVDIRKGDYDFIEENATSISTYWFIDCQYYGQTNDLNFTYNFTNSDVSHDITAFVIASYEPIETTTTVPSTTTPSSNGTTSTSITNTTGSIVPMTSTMSSTTTAYTSTITTMSVATTPIPKTTTINTDISFPYICLNSSTIPQDPNKTYGYFKKEISVRTPITDITMKGTDWIQPWDMLSLNVTCNGSGPFNKCLEIHEGKYNVTGDETCEYTEHLQSCNFSILRYFFDPTEYTILVILSNDVSKQIYPKTITVYKVIPKPQLSVIVVPVSCTLVAVVLIVFGVAYYIQSRAKFTVEVADFDFGQNNPEMEYKTFTERLRDSFNNAGYKQLKSSNALQT